MVNIIMMGVSEIPSLLFNNSANFFSDFEFIINIDHFLIIWGKAIHTQFVSVNTGCKQQFSFSETWPGTKCYNYFVILEFKCKNVVL